MDASDVRYPAVQELAAYWLAHPQASDTLEGICQWWLSGAPVPVLVVEDALTWLVQRGVVTSLRAADGRVRYRLSGESSFDPS